MAKVKKSTNKKTPIIEAKNLGPKTAEALNTLDIYYLEDLIDEGWEEVMWRIAQAFPEYLHSMFAYAMIGAIQNKNLLKLSKQDKDYAKSVVHKMKRQTTSVSIK